jgi:predicted nucleic acid-binding protein
VIVIDAGAFLEVLLRSSAGLIVEPMFDDDVLAPDLLDAEVFNRLVRAEQHNMLDSTAVDERIALLRDAPIDRVPCRDLLTAARAFAAALSGYDALYAALAATLACPLVTTDARLARTAAGQFGVVVTHVPTSGR